MRESAYLSVDPSGKWAAVDDDGNELGAGTDPLVCLQETYTAVRDVFVQTSAELVTLLSVLSAKGRPDNTLIRERAGYGVDCGGFGYKHGADYWLGAMLFPEPVADYCARSWWPKPEGEPMDRVRLWREVHREQTALVQDIAGTPPTHSLASTAFKAALPSGWRHGGAYFQKTVAYEQIRKSCYGSRQEIYRPGWRGDAVELDINSAYGWAMTQPIPDWQVYQRRAYPGECEWLDATVELSGAVGPLPCRNPDKPSTLEWPTSGQFRGWWAAVDLATPGVRIVEVHQRFAGRYAHELRKPVSEWLERRSQSTSDAVRGTIRGMAVGLAGKLWQRPLSWGLWHLSEGHPPDGAVQLGNTAWMVIPTLPKHLPITLPTSASYVTALVRQKVWPYIADGNALYTHTDSVHLTADDVLSGRGPPTGERPGEWSIKAEGTAHYRGINDYTIGHKTTRSRT